MLLELHPEAVEELDAAVLWLEAERPGHGLLLYEEVRSRVKQAARLPRSGAPVTGVPERYDVRCYGLRRFRYRVLTATVGGTTIVVAIAHTSREPGYWRERLGSVLRADARRS